MKNKTVATRIVLAALSMSMALAATGCSDAGTAGESSEDTGIISVIENSNESDSAKTEESKAGESQEDKESKAGDSQDSQESKAGEGAQATESQEADDSWKATYVDFLEKGLEAEVPYLDEDWRDSWNFGFIYLDQDKIPELVLSSGYEAAGNLICTIKNGKVEYLQTSRLNFYYKEYGNLLDNNDGNMGYYYDLIFSIGENGFDLKYSGSYNEVYDDNGYTGEVEYFLDDNAVTQEQYEKTIGSQITPLDRTYWVEGCKYEELMKYLKGTGAKDYKEAYSDFIRSGARGGISPVDAFALIKRDGKDPLLLCVGEQTFFLCAFEDGLLQVGPDWYFSETEFVLVYPDLGMVSNSQYFENNVMSNSNYFMKNGSLLANYVNTTCEYDADWEPILDENGYPITTYWINGAKVSQKEFNEQLTKYDEKFKQQLAPSNAEYVFIDYCDRTKMLNKLAGNG